jgi:antitoxin ParD1/3/4
LPIFGIICCPASDWEECTMSTVNISLPEPMKDFVESQVTEGMYGSASDYIRTLIREDQKRKAQEELEKKLLAALDQGHFQEVTPEFFNQLRARITPKKNENNNG